MKIAGRLFAAFELGAVVKDTIHSYETGGEWQNELYKRLAEVAGSYGGGWAVFAIAGFLGITSAWIVLPSTIGSIGVAYIFKTIAEHLEQNRK